MPKGKKFQGKDKDGDLALVRTKSNATGAEKKSVNGDVEKGAAVLGGRSTPGGSSSYSERTPAEKQEEARMSEKVAEEDARKSQGRIYEPIHPAQSAEKDENAGAAAATAVPERPTAERFVTAQEF